MAGSAQRKELAPGLPVAPDHDGSVLDIGAGGGAGSLPLAPPAALVVAVDQGAEMLASFAATADRLGVAHREVATAVACFSRCRAPYVANG